MKFIKFYLSSIIFFLLTSLNAQEVGYQEGYYIDKNNQKITGFVLYENDKALFEKLVFKKAMSDTNSRSFLAKDIQGFGFTSNSRSFVSRAYKQDFTTIENNKEIAKTITTNLFLEEIVKGKVNLYKHIFSNNGDITYFSEDITNGLKELVYIRQDLQKNISEKRLYRGALRLLFADCEKTAKKAVTVGYTLKQMSTIFKEYNECVNELQYVSENIVQKGFHQFGGVIGGTLSTMGKNGVIVTPEGKGGITLGASYIYKPRKEKKLLLKIGLDYVRKGASSTNATFNNTNQREVTTYDFVFNSLELSLMAGLDLNRAEKLRPYLAGGFIFGKTISGTHTATSQDIAQNNFEVSLKKTNSLGIAGELGLNYYLDNKRVVTVAANYSLTTINNPTETSTQAGVAVDNSALSSKVFAIRIGYAFTF